MSNVIFRRPPIPVTMTRVVHGKGSDVAPSTHDRRELFVIDLPGSSSTRSPPTTPPLPGLAHARRIPRDSPPRSLPFLHSCGTCGRNLSATRDIYIYKGDIAFCSQDCREKRMQWDM